MNYAPIDFNPNELKPWPPALEEETPLTRAIAARGLASLNDAARRVGIASGAAVAATREYSVTIDKMREARNVPTLPALPVRIAVHFEDGTITRYPLGRARIEDSNYGRTKVVTFDGVTLHTELKGRLIKRMVGEGDLGAEICDLGGTPMYVAVGDQVQFTPQLTLNRNDL